MLQENRSGAYDHLIGIPKALLPARPDSSGSGDTILDCWWNALQRYYHDFDFDFVVHPSPLSVILTVVSSSAMCI